MFHGRLNGTIAMSEDDGDKSLIVKAGTTHWMTGVAVYEKPKFPMGATSVFFAKKALSAVSLRGGNFSSNSRLELLTLAGFAVTVALVYGYMFSSST